MPTTEWALITYDKYYREKVSVPREQNKTYHKTPNYSLSYEIASLNPGNLEGQVRNFIGFQKTLVGGSHHEAASQPPAVPSLERHCSGDPGASSV